MCYNLKKSKMSSKIYDYYKFQLFANMNQTRQVLNSSNQWGVENYQYLSNILARRSS